MTRMKVVPKVQLLRKVLDALIGAGWQQRSGTHFILHGILSE